jgi:GNAT superfamily N-acetyltransferase
MNNELNLVFVKNRAPVVDILTDAFSVHPFIPSLIETPARTRLMMDVLAQYFMSTQTGRVVCLSEDSNQPPLCAAIFADATEPLRLPGFLRLCWRVAFGLGPDVVLRIYQDEKTKPMYQAPYLELVILGSRLSAQGKGHGRRMLKALYQLAQKEQKQGVLLIVQQHTPAHALYLKEGFEEVRLFRSIQTPCAWMRKTIA